MRQARKRGRPNMGDMRPAPTLALEAFVCPCARLCFGRLKILVAITGASGALYAKRLLDNLDAREHEIHVVQSNYAQQVITEELPGGLKLPVG
ncbi:MAG: flavoprotein, partial [Limisphaerales bacterium]